jgi:hypothetical protein
MLIGMADESGFQTGGYFGMAGYLADHDVWAELNPLWNEALKKNGAPYLHMKEPHEVHSARRGPLWWTLGRRGTRDEELRR